MTSIHSRCSHAEMEWLNRSAISPHLRKPCTDHATAIDHHEMKKNKNVIIFSLGK
jgi:hypothetical protein